VLLLGAGKEAIGSRRASRASFELCVKQVSDLIDVQLVRRLRDGRLRKSHIALGCGDERFELTFMVARSLNQQPRVVVKVGKLFGRQLRDIVTLLRGRNRCRKLGG